MPANPHVPANIETEEEIHLRTSLQQYQAALALLSRSRRAADILECAHVSEAVVTIKSELERRNATNAA